MGRESESNYVPRAPRFEVSDGSDVVVSVTRTGADEDANIAAELVDISQHGAKLRVPINMQFEESLQLEIDVLGTDLNYHGVASVRHIRSLNDENWIVGCAIAPPLSDETFSYLATAAGKERRRFRRLPIAAEATIRRQAQSEGCEATLHNLSSGGFCCSSPMYYEVGELVQLTIVDTDGEPRTIEARICWQVDGPDGSIVGCQFSSQDSYAELCACLSEQPIQEPSTTREAEPTSRLVLTAAVLAIFAPPLMTLMFQTKQVSAEATQPALVVGAEEKPAVEVIANAEEICEETKLESAPPPEPSLTVAAEQSSYREWVDNTGKHRTKARLIDATDEHIVLEKTNGKQANVPWRRLSDSDREFVQDWQARR